MKKGKSSKGTTKKAAAADKGIGRPVPDKEDEEQLDDPALFEEMNQDRIPKLEKVGKRLLLQQDLCKREKTKEDELDEECQVIMADHQIEVYRVKGLTLRIKRGKAHVVGKVDE